MDTLFDLVLQGGFTATAHKDHLKLLELSSNTLCRSTVSSNTRVVQKLADGQNEQWKEKGGGLVVPFRCSHQ